MLTFSANVQASFKNYDTLDKGEIIYSVAPTQANPCVAKLPVDGVVDAYITDNGISRVHWMKPLQVT